MLISPTSALRIKKITSQGVLESEDILAVEEPLEIRITYGLLDSRTEKNISVTMRTPGNDAELAIGFLFTEGIIKETVKSTSYLPCRQAVSERVCSVRTRSASLRAAPP